MASASDVVVSTIFDIPRKNYILKLNPFSSQLLSESKSTECTRSPKNLILFDLKNKKGWPLNCNAYKCDYCGPRKAVRLNKYVELYLNNWDWVRLFTFTLTTRFTSDKKLHYKMLCEVWRRFNTELRRRKMFSSSQKKFSYIRVSEKHKSGFYHYHCLFSHYFEVKAIYPIWNEICEDVLNFYSQIATDRKVLSYNNLFNQSTNKKYFGWIDAKGSHNAEFGARYVTKYVMKAAKCFESKQKKYTKSHDVKLFPEKIHNPDWILVNLKQIFHEKAHFETIDSYLCTHSLCSTSHDIGLSSNISGLLDIICESMVENNSQETYNFLRGSPGNDIIKLYDNFNEVNNFFDTISMSESDLLDNSSF